ncbi:MAG: ABC-2 transporter permease [Erysipelotrichaceae bacterium]|nr:ABC-2 transporter permease [Erysipelotrichaceae bacterium]
MKALLIKDFKLMKQQIFIYIIIIACIGIVSYMETIVHLSINFVFMDISFLAIIITILSMNAINNDESFNSCPYILSLPINRQTYIIEKYAFGMILGIVSMITIWMINLIIGLIPINRLHDFASIACVLSLPLMITIQSFIIPIRFMIHDRKGKNALLFLICILFIYCCLCWFKIINQLYL